MNATGHRWEKIKIRTVSPPAEEKPKSLSGVIIAGAVATLGLILIVAGMLSHSGNTNSASLAQKRYTKHAEQVRVVWKPYPVRPKLGESWRFHNPYDYYISVKVGVNSAFTPPEIPPGEEWIVRVVKLCGTPPFYVRVREGDEVSRVSARLEKK
jgi:hypothetical protein